MLTESLPPDLQNIVKLGLVADSDLPSILRSSRQVGFNIEIFPIWSEF